MRKFFNHHSTATNWNVQLELLSPTLPLSCNDLSGKLLMSSLVSKEAPSIEPYPKLGKQQFFIKWQNENLRFIDAKCHSRFQNFKVCMYILCTGNSLFFVQDFSLFCDLSLGCYWPAINWSSNSSDCTLAFRWELWRSLAAICRRETTSQQFPQGALVFLLFLLSKQKIFMLLLFVFRKVAVQVQGNFPTINNNLCETDNNTRF